MNDDAPDTPAVDRSWQMLGWGEHMHMALYAAPDEPRATAMERTTATMAADLALTPDSLVLEVACGSGQAARRLVQAYGCRVRASNISEPQLAEGRRLTAAAGLGDRIDYAWGDYHALDEPDGTADLWWCQEALVHSDDKARVLAEAWRVLKPGGLAVLSDVTLDAAVDEPLRGRIGSRIPTPLMWDKPDYDRAITALGFAVLRRDDWSEHVARTYAEARDILLAHRDEILQRVPQAVFDETIGLYDLWVDNAAAGRIGWLHWRLRKPATV